MSQLIPHEPKPRELIDDAERERLEAVGGLVLDGRRSRPRYFDGRFLAARDLTTDQLYSRQRQLDLARAAGWGVVHGLEVKRGPRPTTIALSPGHGLTPAGETVSIGRALTIDLLDLHQSLLLDAHLGLRQQGASASRVGAFVVALRPVEYTAHPRRGYPTTVTGTPTTEDHDIIEATAVTLVPWPESLAGNPEAVRRKLVREIFVAQTGAGLPANMLPIAMVYLNGSAVVWLDPTLVRRPVGAERGDVLGFGVANRAVRAAHISQYRAQLGEILARGGNRAAAASAYFDVLPPVGELPAASIDRNTFAQSWFPPEVDVDIAFVPQDELPLLVEESLLLPPIDLAAGSESLYGTSVLVMVPLPRAKVRSFKATLGSIRRPLVLRVGRVPVVRTPALALNRLRLPVVSKAAAVSSSAPTDPVDAAWTARFNEAMGLLHNADRLWYARRRNMNYRADIEGAVVDIDLNPA